MIGNLNNVDVDDGEIGDGGGMSLCMLAGGNEDELEDVDDSGDRF